jgi:hypothetical protein
LPALCRHATAPGTAVWVPLAAWSSSLSVSYASRASRVSRLRRRENGRCLHRATRGHWKNPEPPRAVAGTCPQFPRIHCSLVSASAASPNGVVRSGPPGPAPRRPPFPLTAASSPLDTRNNQAEIGPANPAPAGARPGGGTIGGPEKQIPITKSGTCQA